MSYAFETRPDARTDIEEAAIWYEQRELGLGIDFTESVNDSIDSLVLNPLAYRLRNRRRNIRWLLVRRFPYKIVYH